MAASDKWLILELNETLDNISYKEILAAITAVFGEKIEYFIPIYHEQMGSYISSSTLMDGYAFVRDTPIVRESACNFREQRIFSRILYRNGQYITVTNKAILDLKKKLKNSIKRNIVIGSKVRVLDGVFKNLVADVINVEHNGKEIVIRINLMSREIIAPVPSTAVEIL